MSEGNGVLRIGRKGKAKFAFGDNPEFELDVIAVYDEWFQADSSARDGDGNVPKEQTVSYSEMLRTFVQNIVKDAYATQYPDMEVPVLTKAEAREFLTILQGEVDKLKGFFAVRSPGLPNSRESTTLRFSQ